MAQRPHKFPPTILKKHDGTTFVRIHQNGKVREVYLGKAGSPEAVAKYARVCAEIATTLGQPPIPLKPLGLTVVEVAERFLAHAAVSYSERGREAEQYALALRPVTHLFGETQASEFGARQLEQVMVAMASGSWMTAKLREDYAYRRITTTLSRKVVGHRLTRIRTVWRWAELQGHVPPGSLAALIPVRVPDRDDPRFRRTAGRQGVEWEDMKKVIDCAPPAVAAMLELQWWTGMRPGEVRIMRACDIDRSGIVWHYRPYIHKNDWRGQDRVVSLGPECQRILLPWLDGEGGSEAFLFRPHGPSPNDHYTVVGFSRAVKRAADRAGVRVQSAQARHSFRVRVTREMSLDSARAGMGHKSILTTNDYSSGVDGKIADDVAKKCG